ncbi:MAG TPA: flagellar assembly protein FliW [Pirellulaceae bacterium]|nr:flagellar assembly protein FliW [Pirellulaceae bacterium]
MQLSTTRFGSVDIEAEDVLFFPLGIAGFEHAQHWVLLADADNDAVAWLQSATEPETAVAVVSPRRFVPEYQVRVSRTQLGGLELDAIDDAHVLAILGKSDTTLTINLKAPLVINLDGRLGRQVITNDEQPLQMALNVANASVRKIA